MKKYLLFSLSLAVLGLLFVGSTPKALAEAEVVEPEDISPTPCTFTYTAGVNGSIQGVLTQTVNVGSSGSEVIAVPDTNAYQVGGNWFQGKGYHFVNWSDEKTLNPRTDTCVAGENINVTANFAVNTITITATAGVGGTISPNGPTTVEENSTPTYTITPDEGYRILDVMVDDVDDLGSVPSYSFPSTRTHHNHYITASFAPNTGGSNGGGSTGHGGGKITPPTTQPQGEVLGAQTFQFTRTLKLGMKGDDVLELHKKLMELGYYKGPIDNFFQSLLKAAVIKFQLANGLKGDGVVGALSRALLNK